MPLIPLLVLICAATAAVLVGWAVALDRARAAAEEAQVRLAFARLSPAVARATAAFASIGASAAEATAALNRFGRAYARVGRLMREEE